MAAPSSRPLPNLSGEVPPQLEKSDAVPRSRDSLRSRERGER
jgi:hypothetical protein